MWFWEETSLGLDLHCVYACLRHSMASSKLKSKCPEIVNRSDVQDNEIDKGVPYVRNKFLWKWLGDKDKNGDYLSKYVRKIKENGKAWCTICDCELKYGTSGQNCFFNHATTKKHLKRRDSISNCLSVDSMFKTSRSLETCEQSPVKSVSVVDVVVYGQDPGLHRASENNSTPGDPCTNPSTSKTYVIVN